MSTSKMKVLALCGFTQNAYIYSRQLGAIRKACKDVDFVFLEPPHIVQKADMPWASNMDDFGSSATTEEEQQTPETTPRAWWLSSGDKKTYRLFDETVSYLHKALIEQGPFDGILGFSQGACMAATLAALLEKPGLHANFPSEPSIPKFKFVISVGGFLPVASDPSFIPYFPLPQHLPVLHVMGKNDTLVTPERSQSLVDACLNSRVELHDGGHFTPSKASWRHFLHAYILSFADGGSAGDVGPIASFGPSGANTPKTGTVPNTPRPSSPNPSSQATPDKPTDSSKGGSSAEDPAPSAS